MVDSLNDQGVIADEGQEEGNERKKGLVEVFPVPQPEKGADHH